MLGFYIKEKKEIIINKDAVLESGRKEIVAENNPSNDSNRVCIYGNESSEQLIEIIMNNEVEHRLSICLLIFSTKNVFFNSLVKETFLKLKQIDINLYKELEKAKILKRVGIKSKWKFW
jgi:hypothetical protein